MFLGGLLTFISIAIWRPAVLLPQVKSEENSMSYSDFVAVMLTALGVMLAVLALFMALLAFIGYRQMLKTAELQATKSAEKILSEALTASGMLSNKVDLALQDGGQLHQMVANSFERDGALHTLVKNAVEHEDGALYAVFVSALGSGSLNQTIRHNVYAGITQWDAAGENDPQADYREDGDDNGI